MKLTPDQKKEILEKVATCLDEWNLRFCDAIAETVYEDPKNDIYWQIKLCIGEEL